MAATVYVGNMPFHASESEIVSVCEEVGPIVSFRFMTDPQTKKSKGYAFCQYQDHETALSACRNLQGYLFRGRQLKLNLAENKNDKTKSDNPVVPDRKRQHDAVDDHERVLVNDALTLALSKMSIAQLTQIILELETLATQDMEQARTILLSNPNLPRAICDAQRMLGVVSLRMLQMPTALQSLLSLDHKRNDRPSKMMKLNDTTRMSIYLKDRKGTAPVSVVPSQTAGPVTRQTSIVQETVSSAVLVNKMQFQIPSDVDSALLRQVMDLKPEQLISLPPEQQQQVIALQQMIRRAAAAATGSKSPLTTCSREEQAIYVSNQSSTM